MWGRGDSIFMRTANGDNMADRVAAVRMSKTLENTRIHSFYELLWREKH